MSDGSIKNLQLKDESFSSYRSTRVEKIVLRIVEWDIIEVEEIEPTKAETEKANHVLKQQSVDSRSSIAKQSILNDQTFVDPNDVAGQEVKNINQDILSKANAAVLAATQSLIKEQENCVNPEVVIKLKVRAAKYSDFNQALEGAIKDPTNKARGVIVNKILTVTKTVASAIKALDKNGLIQSYFVVFNSNTFTDFDIDPEKHALLVNDNQTGSNADAQIIRYGSNVRDTIIGGTERSLQQRGDLKTVQNDAASALSGAVQDYKTRAKESKAVKKVRKFIDQKALSIERGDNKIQIISKDPDKEKTKITPGEDKVTIGNGMTALKFSKWYKNASRKVQYGTSPFSVDYSGWKPNILGKWFGSDNVTKVPTWKRNLGIVGDELLKIAGAVTALKIFEETLERTGAVDSLERFKKQALDRQVRKDGNGVFTDTGQDTSFTGNDVRKDIDRFTRKN